MDATTIQRLNALNQEFYRTVGEDFDRTRGAPWPGWERVWAACKDIFGGESPHPDASLREASFPLPQCGRGTANNVSQGEGPRAHTAPLTLSVLDVGCGNGRFGVFLAERLAKTGHALSLQYHGLDTDAGLLDRAREALGRTGHALSLQLDQRDIIAQPPDSGQYDLVVLFGVLHHVPGSETRRALLRTLAERVAPGGLLAFACWRFMDYSRFRDRIVPWPDDLAGAVEDGDHLLDWRRGEASVLRYCHSVDDTEHAALVSATGLAEIDTYRADGRSGDMNRYSILRKTIGHG